MMMMMHLFRGGDKAPSASAIDLIFGRANPSPRHVFMPIAGIKKLASIFTVRGQSSVAHWLLVLNAFLNEDATPHPLTHSHK